MKLLKRTREFWSVGTCILNRSHSQSMIGLTGDKVLIIFLLLGQDLWSHTAKSHGPSKILIKSCGILKEIKLHRNSIISLMVITITLLLWLWLLSPLFCLGIQTLRYSLIPAIFVITQTFTWFSISRLFKYKMRDQYIHIYIYICNIYGKFWNI